jgi:hypothetical protein
VTASSTDSPLTSGSLRPRPSSDAAEVALRHVAAWSAGLIETLPEVGPDVAERFVGAAERERVLGLVLVAIDRGDLVLTDELVQRVESGHQEAMRWCLRVERRILEIHDWFEAAGVRRWLVLKGAACAHLDEPDPSLRAFADVDLLIAGDELDLAISVLEAHEVQRRIPQRRPGFDRRIGKSVGMKSADAVEVDVHRTLATGGLGARIPLDRLFDRPETFQLAGTPIRALARHHRALHAAYHSVIHTPVPDLRSIRDLGAHLADSDHDLSPLISEAQRWRGTTVLRQAVEATLEMLPIDVPGWRAWVDTTEPDPRDLVLVQRTWQLDTALVDRGLLTELGLLDRMRYLVAVAAPSKELLAYRGESQLGRIRTGTRRWIAGARRG